MPTFEVVERSAVGGRVPSIHHTVRHELYATVADVERLDHLGIGTPSQLAVERALSQ
ncbi:MAG: hypothetical protein ACXWP0_13355 [Ktedonobacterales bacterium]